MSSKIADQTKRSHWRQILIVSTASLVMGLACCGGGFALDGSQNQSLGSLARLLLSVGALSLLVFVSSLFMAFP